MEPPMRNNVYTVAFPTRVVWICVGVRTGPQQGQQGDDGDGRAG